MIIISLTYSVERDINIFVDFHYPESLVEQNVLLFHLLKPLKCNVVLHKNTGSCLCAVSLMTGISSCVHLPIKLTCMHEVI